MWETSRTGIFRGRDAGYALSIILRTKKLKKLSMDKPEHQPDLIIDSLTELLDMFPARINC